VPMTRTFVPVAAAICFAVATAAGQQTPPASSAPTPPTVVPSAIAAAPVPEDERVVAVHHEPHHRQLFQYGTTRILELIIPPNDRSWFHLHEWPVLYVTLGTSTTRTQNWGGEWPEPGARGGAAGGARGAARGQGGPAPQAGAAGADGRGAAAGRAGGGAPGGRGGGAPRATSTTSYFENPVTHRLENTGTGLFRAMVVINETPGDEETTVEAAGFTGEPELTNRWYRAYRIRLAPGEKTTTHRHRAPVAIFQATAGKGQGIGPMNWDFTEPGQWAFYDANVEHEVRNTGDGPLELIEVEVRRK
jgi:mannose-6-phosphate isomerase-like protein (cupin superfamily)